MDQVDSRALRYTDCFARKFSHPGTVRYHILPAASFAPPSADEGFTIRVEAADKAEPAQHDVRVRRDKHRFVPDRKELVIKAGDVVLWNTDQASLPPFSVHGEGEGDQFTSGALSAGCVYTHAFGTPGTYHWTCEHNAGIGGTIVVHPVDDRTARRDGAWAAALEEAGVVVISKRTATPEKLDIRIGQTVFWAIEDGSDVVICLNHRTRSR